MKPHPLTGVSLLRKHRRNEMDKFALLALLQARPGKETEVEEFLKSALPQAQQETGTTTWYAFKTGPSTFGIYDTFATEEGRKAHLNGEIAKALMGKADELFSTPPQIQLLDLLASKTPKA
jgi:quinol monooxygenase YgiN